MRIAVTILLLVAGMAWPRARTGPGELAMTVAGSYDRVLEVVRAASSDGTLHGTSEYESETVINGALAAGSSSAFPESAGAGRVFYKTRARTISPAHFIGSSDRGTVTVRYIVEPVTAGQTRIRIEAIFVEEGRQRRHQSDGLVEAAEFDRIARELKTLDRRDQAQRAEAERRQRDVQLQQQEAEAGRLRKELELARSRLAAATAAVTELEPRVQALRRQALVRVRAEAAEVKEFPFLAAATVQPAAKGDVLTVLQRTPYWTRVRLAGGRQGWIYSLLLEPFGASEAGTRPAPAPAATLRSDLR